MSDAFAGPGGEHPERRTVHIAIDIFMEPGSPVRAPLPGRVHSVRDNAARLDYGPTVILEHAPEGAPHFYTLYGHLARASVAGLAAGDRVERGQAIATIGPAPENGDWPPHVHFQVIADMLDMQGDFPGVSAASARAAWLSLCPDPNLILGGPARFRAAGDERERLETARRRRLGPSLSLSYRAPLEIVRGAGTLLYDATGRTYLDMVNNVAHVGHCHPRVVRAGARQMAVLNTNTRYLHPSIVRYAERLTATLPEPLSVCFFVCSGSEANELALRMARARSGGRGVVVVDGAYHGNTQGLVDVSPYKSEGPGGQGLPAWVRKAPMPDDYRGLYRRDDPERGAKFAGHVRGALAELEAANVRPAAFLCESLLSCGGQIELPPGYLAAAYAHARSAGGGQHRRRGAGRVWTRRRAVLGIRDPGRRSRHRHDGQAHRQRPPARRGRHDPGDRRRICQRHGVLQHLRRQPRVLRDRARGPRRHPRRAPPGARTRGRRAPEGGAAPSRRPPRDRRRRPRARPVPGIELVRDRAARSPAAEAAAYVVERMKDHGILLSTDGPEHNVIKMKPPLSFSDADADRALAALDRVLSEDFVRET